jgi:hypothetical protein
MRSSNRRIRAFSWRIRYEKKLPEFEELLLEYTVNPALVK